MKATALSFLRYLLPTRKLMRFVGLTLMCRMRSSPRPSYPSTSSIATLPALSVNSTSMTFTKSGITRRMASHPMARGYILPKITFQPSFGLANVDDRLGSSNTQSSALIASIIWITSGAKLLPRGNRKPPRKASPRRSNW